MGTSNFKAGFGLPVDNTLGEFYNENVNFAGGGSRGLSSGNDSFGGKGGGASSSASTASLHGIANTEGGGAGARAGNEGQINGGNGGSGIVIIRYKYTREPVPVVTINDDYKYFAFTNTHIDPALIVHYKIDDDTNIGLNSSSFGSVLDATTNGSPTIVTDKYKIGKSSLFSGAGEDDALVIDSNNNKLKTYINNQSITKAF